MAIVAAGGDVRTEMIDWIRRNYGDMLGKDAGLLDRPGGLDAVQRKYCSQFLSRARKAA
ncbi:MAG: hypothetical protein ACYTKD_02115 [Planctomycetota bacterium]|jgi:hypothetical protein